MGARSPTRLRTPRKPWLAARVEQCAADQGCRGSKMRIRFIALVALALIGTGASAQAADMYGSRAPYTVQQPLNVYSWAGPYVGANVGYGWGDITHSIASPSGINGGIQAGHNW